MLLKDHNGIPLHSLTNLSIAEEELNDYKIVHSSGLLPSIDTDGDPADIWNEGGVYTFSTSAVTHYISSSNNSDNQQIRVIGLDENWQLQTKFIDLVGRTKTAIEGTWIRINAAQNIDSTEFAGDVYIYEDDTITDGVPDTASKIRAVAIPSLQVYRGAIYTVPAGKTAFILEAFSNIGPKAGTALADKGSELYLYIKNFGSVFRALAIRVASLYENTVTHKFPVPYRVPEKSDIKITCTECFVNNSKIFAGFYFILKNN